MAFYIYYHWARDKQHLKYHSKIHRGECGFCKNGHGFRIDKIDGLRGKWAGGFKTYEEAYGQASTYDSKTFEVLDCKSCKPKIHRNVDEI